MHEKIGTFFAGLATGFVGEKSSFSSSLLISCSALALATGTYSVSRDSVSPTPFVASTPRASNGELMQAPFTNNASITFKLWSKSKSKSAARAEGKTKTKPTGNQRALPATPPLAKTPQPSQQHFTMSAIHPPPPKSVHPLLSRPHRSINSNTIPETKSSDDNINDDKNKKVQTSCQHISSCCVFTSLYMG